MTDPITLQCSQGGIPYNKEALDAKDREIERLTDQANRAIKKNGEQFYEVQRLRAVVESIAANTHCNRSQLAALVAREALKDDE